MIHSDNRLYAIDWISPSDWDPAEMSTDYRLGVWVSSLLSSNEYRVVTGYRRASTVVINAILMAADYSAQLFMSDSLRELLLRLLLRLPSLHPSLRPHHRHAVRVCSVSRSLIMTTISCMVQTSRREIINSRRAPSNCKRERRLAANGWTLMSTE